MLNLDGLREDATAAQAFSQTARHRLHAAQASLAARTRRWKAAQERQHKADGTGAHAHAAIDQRSGSEPTSEQYGPSR